MSCLSGRETAGLSLDAWLADQRDLLSANS
jgi:hypothetical protein